MAEIYIFSPDDKLLTIITEETGLISAPFREELNQVPDTPFSFTVESDTENARYVVEENQVVFKDKEGEFRLYVIKELDDIDNIDGPQTTAICLPAFLVELKDHIIVDRRVTNKEAQEALNVALEGTRWTGEVEVSLGLNSTNFYYMTSVDAIWNILSIWGGEFKDVVEFDEKNNIVSRKIKILQRRGADRGKRFEIDHDIEEIQRTVLSYPVTALYGRGASLAATDEEGNETGAFTRYIDFADVEWKKSNGDPVDKPKGQKWVGDPDALQKYGYLKADSSKLHRFGVIQNQNITDQEELLQWTWEQLQTKKKPEVNYALSVHLLEMIAGYEHEHVELGDTATAIDRQFARPIEIQSRVIAIQYDLVDIEGTAAVEMGQFLSVYQYDDRVDKIEEIINNNRGTWEAGAGPITNDRFPDIKPGIPTNVEAIGGFKVIQLYWEYDSNVYISHYEVYGSQVADFVPDNQHLLWRGRVSSFSHEVNTDEVWYYRVRAVNTRGTPGDFSPEVSASTVRIISDDILFGEDIAAELRELSKTSQLLADGTIDLSMIGEDVTEEIESAKTSANNAVEKANQATQNANDAITQAQIGFDTAQSALTTANNATDIATTAKTIAYESANQATNALTRAQSAMDEAKKKADINSVYTKTEIDRALTGYASVTAVNTLTGRVDKAETAITQNANNIALKADKNVVDTLKNTIDNHSTLISQNADAIALKANQSTVDALTGRVSTAEATLTTQANQIAARITKTDADAKYATQTALTATANSLTSSIVAVQTNLDNLEIGGRNLVIRNNEYVGKWLNTSGTLENNATTNTMRDYINVTPGETLTFQKENTTEYFRWNWYDANKNYISRKPDQRNVFQWVVPDNAYYIWVSYPNVGNVKIERGNKATDWTPAPEDMATVTQFNTLQQTLDSTTSRIGNAEGSISTLQQTASSLASRITNTEGNISTLTQTANALQTRMTNAEGNISTLTQTASSLQSTISSVRADLDGLEIGGRNLFRNSDFKNGLSYWDNNGNINMSVVADQTFGNVLQVITTDGWQGPYQTGTDVIYRQQYTVSVWLKADSPTSVNIQNSGQTRLRCNVTTDWQKFVVTFIPTTSKSIGFYPNESSTFYIAHPKFEIGNRATDWTPAPEDMATQSQFTQLADAINLRVQKGDVINQINLSTEGILIDGNKIRITGQTLIDNGVIKSAHIADAAITSAKIANLAVGTAAIANGAITQAKLGTAVIGTAQIEDGAITNAKIANAAIDSAKIANLAVTDAKIASLNVNKLNGSIATFIQSGFNGITSQVSITGSGLETYSSGQRTSLLDGDGHYFYKDGRRIGKIGANAWLNDLNYRGLTFMLDYNSDYMTWAYKKYPSDAFYTTMIAWHKTSTKDNKGFTFSDDVHINSQYAIKFRYFRTINYTNGERGGRLINLDLSGVPGFAITNDAGTGGIFIGNDGKVSIQYQGAWYDWKGWVVN